MLIGFLVWFLIFISQILYFSSSSVHHYCWFPPCKKIVFSSRLHKKQQKVPNPYDKSLLLRIHRQPLLQKYESRHVNLIRLAKPIISTKYLIYTCNQPCGGWGDRTRKIVGAYLLSLVLNRTFIINMTWPCPITHLLEPNFIKWNQTVKNLSKRTNVTVSNLTASDKDYGEVLLWENIDIIYFKVKDLAYYSLLLWRDDFYRILHLQYGLHRSKLFIHTIFTLIYELLFKLKSHPQSHMNEISEKIQSKSLYCAHIRIGKNPSNPNDVIFPKRERMNTSVIGFLKNISKSNDLVFISTDSEEVQSYARKLFRSRLLTIDGIIRHIDRSGKKLACDGLEKTILDFYMISHCHTLIMSKSAFSFWANMRRLNPYDNLYLYCDGIKNIRGPGDYDRYPYVFSISCYKCLSINGSNPSCEDTFQGDVTGKSSFLYAPCLTNLRGRKGLFPATHCIKLVARSRASIPVQYMYRTCARDEADDNEITRASHCGLLKLDWIDKSQRLRGCLHICDKDALYYL
ncbi:unnamed protein product [Rotaria sp. Silwood1]|nr:unnamed protein product [Rotaria sp. Silwood1]CAF0836978.1 unnamed protein product [Rotaria sp. Silwood1]CAF3367121.1 unnamed protein product [Rotaria sp. Silwood1]CAF3369018.1 unnamed protein product [Rotaria sp. Silwood1]CAF4828200.1 unnamed protein product [Rotaria sp. Silwood1]